MRPGMRLGEALAMCPTLELVEQDPAEAGAGLGGGRAPARGRGIRGRAGRAGLPLLRHARASSGSTAASPGCSSARSPRSAPLGRAGRRRGAEVRRARRRERGAPGQALVVEGEQASEFLAPLPLSLLPLDENAVRRARGLGDEDRGTACGASGLRGRGAPGTGRTASVEPGAGRGPTSRQAPPPSGRDRRAARVRRGGRQRAHAAPRARDARRATLGRPERAGRAVRKLALSARLVGGGSWRRSLTLREPTAEGSGCGSRSGRSSPSCRRR